MGAVVGVVVVLLVDRGSLDLDADKLKTSLR